MKYLKLFWLLLICFSGAAYADANINAAPSSEMQRVGRFSAPMFFTHYNQEEIDNIVITPRAKSIRITYPPKLKNVAIKIMKRLQVRSKLLIQLQELDIPDSETTKYRHDAVIVVFYFY